MTTVPSALEGLVVGPVRHRVHEDRVRRFVEATDDDPDRWTAAAPPGYAAIALFAVAGSFLWDSRVAEFTRTLIHVDQAFVHHRPFEVGADLEISGTVERVRERAGSWFVTFRADAVDSDGPVLDSSATFLMSDRPAADPPLDTGEPPATERAESSLPAPTGDRPEVGTSVGPSPRSASRADLVRYAAATDDFNPIHWDHDAARGAGLEGVVVHGLLMHAWAAQAVASFFRSVAPVARMKTRFRSPLRPGRPASVEASVVRLSDGMADVSVRVESEGRALVTSVASARVTP